MSKVTPLRRTAIIVRDMARSLEFYQKVLGLRIWREGASGPDNVAFSALLGAPPCRLRYAVLQSDDVEWGMVGLFELTDPEPEDDTHHSIDRANRGEACLVFHTADIRGIHRRAKAMGLTVLCPPTRLVLEAFGLDNLEMTLRDPNGVLVNLIQNVRGGLAPHNRFPGMVRASARPTRVPKGSKPRKNSALKRKPSARVKPRSGASRRRRSG